MTSDLQAENLAEAVLRTFAFFDTFNYPLTPFEAWHFCAQKTDFSSVLAVLSEDFLAIRLAQKNGFYFLCGREELVEKRREFSGLAEKKMRRARWVACLWRFVPGLKGVAVCNNFYYRPDSDIDLFVITAKDSLWLTRFLATVIAQISGLRRYRQNISNQVCLSFFVSEEGTDLSPLLIPGGDPYFIFWFAFLDPIFDDGVFQNFWESNQEIRAALPNFQNFQAAPFRALASRRHFLLAKKFDDFFRQLQKKRMEKKTRQPDNEATGVVISDAVLKFHEQDRRREFRTRFENNLRKHL